MNNSNTMTSTEAKELLIKAGLNAEIDSTDGYCDIIRVTEGGKVVAIDDFGYSGLGDVMYCDNKSEFVEIVKSDLTKAEELSDNWADFY